MDFGSKNLFSLVTRGLRGGVCMIHAARFQPSCSIYDSATGASREFQIWEILCGV